MRVLIAHNRYRIAGGEERAVDLLEQGLREAGIDVQRFERDSADIAQSRPRQLAAAATLAYRPGGGGVGEVVDRWKPDVVHFHNTWPLLTPAALRIASRRGAKVVLTLHNYRFACPGAACPSRDQVVARKAVDTSCIHGSPLSCALKHSPRGSLVESWAYALAIESHRRLRLLERWADAVLSPSAFVRDLFVAGGFPRARTHVIPHGLPETPAGSPGGDFALFAGRLSPEKGIATLVAAAEIAADVPLVIAGEGPQVPVGPNVTYVGRLERDAMARTLADAAFVVAPSECHDNFPYSALEALAAGKPVIATRVGGLPEMVVDGQTGLLVPPLSPLELAQAMRTLWHDPGLTRELGTRAGEDVRERFTLELQVERTVSLYRSLLGETGYADVEPAAQELVTR